MGILRNIDQDKSRQIIVKNCVNLFKDFNITPLAEGIETLEEMLWLRAAGIDLMQGYLFAKPGFECLPSVDFDALAVPKK